MTANQTILFTVIPRGISVNAETLPVSILVSPRLIGESQLGAYPDWLDWTGQLAEHGLTILLRSDTRNYEARINTEVLEPRLWRALFNEGTFVRSHEYRDLTERGVMSYSVRESMSTLKSLYQEAAVTLALPNGGAAATGEQDERGNRQTLINLSEGLDVHWNPKTARRLRTQVRLKQIAGESLQPATRALDADGYIAEPRSASTARNAALPFAVFHKMPTPERETAPPVTVDPDSYDFHQALSMLESHPELLRALGLVFDLDLPLDFLPATGAGFGAIAVENTSQDWRIPTKSPPLDTAYIRLAPNAQQDYFFTAPAAMAGAGASSLWQILGLLNLDPQRFGVAQIDVDGGMHKMIALAESWHNPDPGRNQDQNVTPEAAPNPELHDTDATLPALRSSGFQLFADGRGLQVLNTLSQSKAFNQAMQSGGTQPRPFFAEDVARGYRLDIWDSHSNAWHSLHRRIGNYAIGDEREPFATEEEEGFFEFAATQPAPEASTDPDDATDLYVHEVIARWAGWSLSVPPPGKSLSRHGDPEMAVPPDNDDPDYRTDEAVTAFKIRADYVAAPGSLPQLRYGRRYRLRARAVDLCGNSLAVGAPLADSLALTFALPRDAEGSAYLRYDPVIAPLVIIRDTQAVTGPGSAVDRIVIRSFNAEPSKDSLPADLTANDRHIVPPRSSVENAERHALFDDAATGKLKSDAATWQLTGERDAAEFSTASITIAGNTEEYPVEAGDSFDKLPHLPDPIARGAAFRDLPGANDHARAQVYPAAAPAAAVDYAQLDDPNPRPGSATLISFAAEDATDWLALQGLRFALEEPAPGQTDVRPQWDAASRVLKVFLSKGELTTVPLSSYLHSSDLKLMGIWHWLRDYINRSAILDAAPVQLVPGAPVDRIAHVLQRAVEGGHWMLNPPRLLTLVHAVQQPLGRPTFQSLRIDYEDPGYGAPLLTAASRGRTDPAELAPITAWRRMGSTDAYLLGAIGIHGASTAKIDLTAEWTDPVDDPSRPAPAMATFRAAVDELPMGAPREGYLRAPGKDYRNVGYYDPEHDQIALVQSGDRAHDSTRFPLAFAEAAPRHRLRDTKRHRVFYTAIASSRYREYFAQDQDLVFSRSSEPVLVDVPASERPLAPAVSYVIPTFGWQRQTETNLKRSVRFGGGLRVYLERPWFSSGAGELLGVACWSYANGTLDNAARDKFKGYFTQWGMDPIWRTGNLTGAPQPYYFADAVATDFDVSLEESNTAAANGQPGLAGVAGFEAHFDASRDLWFADLTVNVYASTYAPFIRLALVRYQPHALPDARISRVVLADYAQLTPDRSALVSADPHHPRSLRVTISGVAPQGPLPTVKVTPPATLPARPTHVRVRVQERGTVQSDLAWTDAPATVATVQQLYENQAIGQIDLALWIGQVTFAARPQPGQFRLLIEEYEYISANYADEGFAPGRLIYAETVEIDSALVE